MSAADPCPYPGLRAFFTDECDWYFGREAHVDAMLACLESSRFLAVVGPSGSGKSSLVFAGLIPALREGQLAGSFVDAAGAPAPWDIVSFHPGNDPLNELAAAIFKAAPKHEDPHLAGYIKAALHAGGQGLFEALKVAGILDPQRETLIYADQFEELFRFGEKSTRAAQENALHFASLIITAAEQQRARLHILLSMRSEFIGECERFPGLPELVSRSQFLTPRLNRKQLDRSLGCPAVSVGWKVSADALTAILNDCGNSPDQLPLAQHVLRRMWKHAADEHRSELTIDDYNHAGRIRNCVAIHGNAILESLPKPAGEEAARLLFMALCEQREEGPLVRRLATREEVEAIAGDYRAIVPEVVAAFGGDDPGFIREDKGWLDVRHEAVLRQWPKIAAWRLRETESEAWLHKLSQAADDYDESPDQTELWKGNTLRMAEKWMRDEKPSKAWAARHLIQNWERCEHFLRLSREEAARVAKEKAEYERKTREAEKRRARNRIILAGSVAAAALMAFALMAVLWTVTKAALESAEKNSQLLEQAQQDALDAKVRSEETVLEITRNEARKAADERSRDQLQAAAIAEQLKIKEQTIDELQKRWEDYQKESPSLPSPARPAAQQVDATIYIDYEQQRSSAEKVRAGLLEEGFDAIDIKQGGEQTRSDSGPPETKLLQAVLKAAIEGGLNNVKVFYFEAASGKQPRFDIWLPKLKEETSELIARLAGTAGERAEASTRLAAIAQLAVKPLLEATVSNPSEELRFGAATTLYKMRHPILLDADDARLAVGLLKAARKETRVAASDFLMDLEDGSSVWNVLAELKKLVGANPDLVSPDSAIHYAGLIAGTWARTLNGKLQGPEKRKLINVALETVKTWRDMLARSQRSADASDTLSLLNDLIARVEPPAFEITLENRHAKPFPKSSGGLALYLAHFSLHSNTVVCYIFHSVQAIPDDEIGEAEFKQRFGNLRHVKLTLSKGQSAQFTIDDKTFTATAVTVDAARFRQDHATLSFQHIPSPQ